MTWQEIKDYVGNLPPVQLNEEALVIDPYSDYFCKTISEISVDRLGAPVIWLGDDVGIGNDEDL